MILNCTDLLLLLQLSTIEASIPDENVWEVQNKLKLNDDKTEIFLLIGSATGIDLPVSLPGGQSDVPFVTNPRRL